MYYSNIQNIIFRLYNSTKTRKRDHSLFQVAEDLIFLREKLGGMKNVSKEVDVTSGMLNKFLSVYKVSKPVQNLIEERKIDSVSIVFYLSQLNHPDQEYLANLFLKNKLTSQDLRVLVPLRKKFPDEELDILLDRIQKSKNRKISVIEFSEANLQKSISEVEALIETIIGFDEIIELNCNDASLCRLKVTKEGEKKLRAYSKRQKLTLQQLMEKIIK